MYDYNNYNYDYSNSYTTTEWGQSYTTIDNPILDQVYAILPIVGIITSLLGLLMIISMWKIYKKAGKHGWASIVPIYNIIVLIEIAGLPLWYFVLLLIPFVNIYAMFKIYIEIAHKFGKSTGFGVLSVFFPIICLPILAFGKCTYEGKDNNVNTESSNLNNNTGINEAQLQNIVNNNENMNEINNNNDLFTPTPVIPSFIPTNDINNNMQINNTLEDNSNNNIEPNTLAENVNDSINNEPVLWETNNNNINNNLENNTVISSKPIVEDVSLNVINPIENNVNVNTINNDNNNIPNVIENNTNFEVNNAIVNDISANVAESEQINIPEIQNIGIMPNIDTTMNAGNEMTTVTSENIVPSVSENTVDNILEVQNNTEISMDMEKQDNVSEINNLPNNPEIHNDVTDNQNVLNNPVNDSNKNITDTMSLNELLADIKVDEQK